MYGFATDLVNFIRFLFHDKVRIICTSINRATCPIHLPSTSQILPNYSRSTRFRASMEPRYTPPLQCISVKWRRQGMLVGRFKLLAAGRMDDRIASEKITILFFTHLPSPDNRRPTSALSARTTPADSPTRLCEIIDVEITGKDERVYCFAVEHADWRPGRRRDF